jgi:PIN domain nuclease of toxin-antitoxin system
VSDSDVVSDASAVLALLRGEEFLSFDPERIAGSWINAVNLSEVIARLRATGLSMGEADLATDTLELRVIAFDRTHAAVAGHMSTATRRAGLSLGDRACLATAIVLGVPAVTGDKAWASLDVGANVILIR